MSEERVEVLPFRILVIGKRQIKTLVQDIAGQYSFLQVDRTHRLEPVVDRYPARAAWSYGFLALRNSRFPLPNEEFKPCWVKEESPGFRGEEIKRKNYVLSLCEDNETTRSLVSTLQDLNLPCQDMPFYFISDKTVSGLDTILLGNLHKEFPIILEDVMNQCRKAWLKTYFGVEEGVIRYIPAKTC